MYEDTSSRGGSRWIGGAGIGFAVLMAGGMVALGGTPKYDAPDREWTRWLDGSGHRASQVAGLFLITGAVLLLLVFSTSVLRRARAAGASGDAVAVARAAGIVFAAVAATGAAAISTISAAKAFAPDNFPTPAADLARVLDQLGYSLLLGVGGLTAAVFVAAVTRALRRTSFLPSWLTTAGYVVAVLLLASVAWIPMMLLPLWVLAAGASLVAHPASETIAETGADIDADERPAATA